MFHVLVITKIFIISIRKIISVAFKIFLFVVIRINGQFHIHLIYILHFELIHSFKILAKIIFIYIIFLFIKPVILTDRLTLYKRMILILQILRRIPPGPLGNLTKLIWKRLLSERNRHGLPAVLKLVNLIRQIRQLSRQFRINIKRCRCVQILQFLNLYWSSHQIFLPMNIVWQKFKIKTLG